MEKKFNPSTWAQPVEGIVKEYEAQEAAENAPEDVPEKPEALSTSLVRKGLIDPLTGHVTGNSKQGCIRNFNLSGYSPRGKRNYEMIFGHR